MASTVCGAPTARSASRTRGWGSRVRSYAALAGGSTSNSATSTARARLCGESTCRSWRSPRAIARTCSSRRTTAARRCINPVSGAVSSDTSNISPRWGRLAAMALYHGETFPLRLTPAFCDRILGVPMRLDHLESVDPTLYKNQVRYVLDHGPEGLDLTWRDVADPTGVFSPGELAPLRDRDPDAEVTREDAPGGTFARSSSVAWWDPCADRRRVSRRGFGAVIPAASLAHARVVERTRTLRAHRGGANRGSGRLETPHRVLGRPLFADVHRVVFWRAMETFTAEERVAVLQWPSRGSRPRPRAGSETSWGTWETPCRSRWAN